MRLVALITVAVLALFAVIFYLDMPLAEQIHALGLWQSLRSSSVTQAPVMLAAGMAAVVLGCCSLVFRLPFARLCRSATLAGFATLLSFVLVKGFLKEIFGRAFPYITVGHGSDAFHWFSALEIERSFPSTHAAELAAILAVFWIRHPRWKAPYLLVALAMNTAMLLGEWHFLSDILVGSVLGIANAKLVMAMAKRIAQRVPATERAHWTSAPRPAKLTPQRRNGRPFASAKAGAPVRELR
jgi:membrane-associated phospholipid phosphatase